MLLESDPAEAAQLARNILSYLPQHEGAQLLLTAASRRSGDSVAATTAIESACRDSPTSSLMQLELGRTYAASGRNSDALAAIQRAVTLDPQLADGWRELAALHFLNGHNLEGDTTYLKYYQLVSEPHELIDAKVAFAEGRLEAAEAVVRLRLRLAPGDVVALYLLGAVAARRGDQGEAERIFNACLDLAPGYATARFDLARLLFVQQRVAEVIPLIERLLAAEPSEINYLSLKAQAIRFLGRNDEAIALMQQVVACSPNDAHMWLVYGNLLREIGEQNRAIEAYRRALAARAGLSEAYWALANLKTFRFTSSDLETMRQLLAKSPAFGPSRVHLEFALGKAHEDARQFEISFTHYARGNALHRATMDYEPSTTTAYVQRSKAVYTKKFFADRSSWGISSNDPIFIVGLPRSGSTLLEQILASHSQIEGTRELLDLPAMVTKLISQRDPDGELKYPEPVASLARIEIETMAAQYLEQTKVYRPLGKPRFVDKMLGNFNHVGLIHLMFPHASIIDTRRHPLACGFSCYKQLFARGMNFTYELDDIGRCYRDYFDLMEHLDQVLTDRVHRVHYEQLVADFENEVRRLLNYCRLPFEAECLRFYDNRRIVQTVSSEQVRRPIFSDEVNKWRNYEPWLGPLKDVLGDLIDRYPTT